MKRSARIFKAAITAAGILICLAGLSGIYYYMTYHIVGTIILTVNGAEVCCDGFKIGIEDHMGSELVEICEIQGNRFRFQKKQYGDVYMLLMIPKKYLEGYGEDIAVEIKCYNNAAAVTKSHNIRIEVTDIDAASCCISFTDTWKPAYDIGGAVSDELVGEKSIAQEKKITVKNSYISNYYSEFYHADMHWGTVY